MNTKYSCAAMCYKRKHISFGLKLLKKYCIGLILK